MFSARYSEEDVTIKRQMLSAYDAGCWSTIGYEGFAVAVGFDVRFYQTEMVRV